MSGSQSSAEEDTSLRDVTLCSWLSSSQHFTPWPWRWRYYNLL